MLPWLPRYLARTLAFATAFSVLLALPSLASALGPPTITGVGQTQHHATLSWALPAGSVSRGVEISDSPSVASDGAFFGDHVKSADTITEAQTTYTSNGVLDPGTYYIHVAAYVPNCDTCPSYEWSAITTLVLSPGIQPVVEGNGTLTVPGGPACAGATCALTDAAAGPVLLTAAPAAGFLVLSWDVEGIDAADTCGIRAEDVHRDAGCCEGRQGDREVRSRAADPRQGWAQGLCALPPGEANPGRSPGSTPSIRTSGR